MQHRVYFHCNGTMEPFRAATPGDSSIPKPSTTNNCWLSRAPRKSGLTSEWTDSQKCHEMRQKPTQTHCRPPVCCTTGHLDGSKNCSFPSSANLMSPLSPDSFAAQTNHRRHSWRQHVPTRTAPVDLLDFLRSFHCESPSLRHNWMFTQSDDELNFGDCVS